MVKVQYAVIQFLKEIKLIHGIKIWQDHNVTNTIGHYHTIKTLEILLLTQFGGSRGSLYHSYGTFILLNSL